MVGCWRGYLSGARCRLAYGPADATATVSCFSKIQIGLTFLVPAHPGSPGKRAVKRVCVCVSKMWVLHSIVICHRHFMCQMVILAEENAAMSVLSGGAFAVIAVRTRS